MTYIDRINAFNLKLLEEQVSPNARAMYYQLLDLNNKLGWRETFRVANMVIASNSNLSVQQMYRARTELVTKGFVTYKKPEHKQATGIYHLIILKDYKVEYQKTTNFNTKPGVNPEQTRTKPGVNPEQTRSKPDNIK